MSEGQAQSWPDGWAGGQAEGAQLEAFVLQNPTAYFYAWDHLGTVRLVTDSSGAVVDQHDFEPYGVEIRPLQNASLNTLRYTGYERDEATGLDYAHFRFLASTLGRFMKPDNIMGNPMNPQSWNLYSYVQGNPVNFNDPTGHAAVLSGQTVITSSTEDSTAARTVTVTENGNVKQIEVVETMVKADSEGNYTKTTTTQTTTITKTADGQEHSFTGKATQTVETGKSDALGKIVQENKAVASQDLNGPAQKHLAPGEAMIGAAQGGKIASSGEIKGVTEGTQAMFKTMDPHTSGLGWGANVRNGLRGLGIVLPVVAAGFVGPEAVLAERVVAAAGVAAVPAGVATGLFDFEY